MYRELMEGLDELYARTGMQPLGIVLDPEHWSQDPQRPFRA